jgi:DNA-binding transcriptional LysR family regulator
MHRRLPPLNSLRLFEASARFLSFKNAAEELLLTPSAVSHGIRSLEQWLGARLFIRTPRGLELTDAGARYYPVVKSALGMLANGTEQVSVRHDVQRRLAISAAPTFASRVLIPSLARFREQHPGVAVAIDTAHEHAELGDTGVNLAIRMGRGAWDGLVAERLLGETLVPVCAPERYRQFKDRYRRRATDPRDLGVGRLGALVRGHGPPGARPGARLALRYDLHGVRGGRARPWRRPSDAVRWSMPSCPAARWWRSGITR